MDCSRRRPGRGGGPVAAVTTAPDLTGRDVRKVARFSLRRDLRTLQVYHDNRTDLGGEVARMVAAQV